MMDEIKKHLEGVNFPIAKDDLVSMLRDKGASDKIIGMIQDMPMDEIQSPGDIYRALNPMK